MNKVPKPVTFAIFLLFITVVGLMLGSMMHLQGIHCNTNKEVVKTSATDFFNNARVIFASEDELSATNYTMQQLVPDVDFSDIVFYAKLNTSLGIYVPCGENDTGCLYYLRNGACYNCSYKEVCVAKYAFICGDYEQICYSDAYAWNAGSLSSTTACLFDYVKIPNHYLWNITSGVFECAEPTVCGVSPTAVSNTQLDDLLESMGAEAYYTEVEDISINRIVQVTCIGTTPSLSFFKVPLLDYKVWVLLAVIFIMFLFLSHIGQQNQLR